MPFKTYAFNIRDRAFRIQGQKDWAEEMARRLQTPAEMRKYYREITGRTTDEERHAADLYVVFGNAGELEDPQGYEHDLQEYLSTFPLLITPDNIQPLLQAAQEVYDHHILIVDKRQTPEQIADREAKAREWEEKRQRETDAWVAEWARSAERVPISKDQMAVYLDVTFDDSDSMTDYYAPHRSVGHPLLLALVPRQPKTRRLAEAIIERYPELKALGWTWHTENYAMGHGNYLMSGVVGEIDHAAYDGRPKVAISYEIRFDPWAKAMLAYKNYPGDAVPSMESTPPATVARNEALNGVEVRFDAKPSEDVIGLLKAQGFRWSFRSRVWYRRYSPQALEWAQQQFGGAAA